MYEKFIHPTELGDYVVKIEQDNDVADPREWDNIGKMICWHRRYLLGDEKERDSYSSPRDFMLSLAGIDEDNKYYSRMNEEELMEAASDKAHKKYVILPLYLYDHSGITMNTSGFSCRWDSGQVGFIYVELKGIAKKHGFTKKWLKQYHDGKTMTEVAREILKGEVETYDHFLTGNCFGWQAVRPEDWNEEDESGDDFDACWGYYGDDHDASGLKEAAIHAIGCDVKKRLEKKRAAIQSHADKLKGWIRSKLPVIYRKPFELNY